MTAASRLGATIQGKYHLERVLGEGGMGVVYGARHVKLDRPVAIKVMHASFAASETAVHRFFDEARAAGRLRHPNVIDVLDVDLDDSHAPFMVMEMLDGEPLSALLARRGPMPPEEVVALLDPVLDALAVAHASGIVHRDLKPDNVFLARVGASTVPKILDFGIAKLRDARTPGTATGAIVGTPMYMAPEQAAGTKDIGPWVDVWAMGALYFEAITGRSHLELPPEAGVMAILSALATSTPRRVAEVAPSTPESIATAIDAALVTDPARRTRSIERFREMLSGRPIADTRASDAPLLEAAAPIMIPATRVLARGPRTTGLWIAAAIVLSSILGLGAWAALRPREPAPTSTATGPADLGTPTSNTDVARRDEGSETPPPATASPTDAVQSVETPAAPDTLVDGSATSRTREHVRTSPPETPRIEATPPETTMRATGTRTTATRTGTWNPDDL